MIKRILKNTKITIAITFCVFILLLHIVSLIISYQSITESMEDRLRSQAKILESSLHINDSSKIKDSLTLSLSRPFKLAEFIANEDFEIKRVFVGDINYINNVKNILFESKINFKGYDIGSTRYYSSLIDFNLFILEKNLIIYLLSSILVTLILIIFNRSISESIKQAERILNKFLENPSSDLTIKPIDSSELTNQIFKLINKFNLKSQEFNSAKKEFELEQLKNKIALSLAHDIKSPLAVLKSIEIKSDNQDLSFSITRIEELRERLLSPSLENNKQYLLIGETLDNIISKYKRLYPNILFTFKLVDNFSIELNSLNFERSIFNILDNSVDALKNIQSPRIDVSIQKGKITISDNGYGIPEDIRSSVFEQGFSYGKEKGNGLGLFQVISFLKRNHAEVKYYYKNNKSYFTLIFHSISFDYKNEIKDIIHIDDDFLIRKIWKKEAKKQNIGITSFSSANEVRSVLQDIQKDAIFYIDENLGEEKGRDLAKELYESGYENLYLSSGYEDSEFTGIKFIKGNVGKEPPTSLGSPA